jgi:hypothetical protein
VGSGKQSPASQAVRNRCPLAGAESEQGAEVVEQEEAEEYTQSLGQIVGELILAGDKTPQEWADYCRESEREAVEQTIEWCKRIRDARISLEQQKVTFREWAKDYYTEKSFPVLCKLSKIGENAEFLFHIMKQRKVANDWAALYSLTTLKPDERDAALHGEAIGGVDDEINQKSIGEYKQKKNHPPAEPAPFDGDMGVITGRFQDEGQVIADESVSLIFTDPPYDKKTLPQYADLAAFADRVLIPGGSLITYLGDYALPEVCAMFAESSMTFHWPLICTHTGQTANFNWGPYQSLKIKNKLMLWYRKGQKLHRGDTIVETLIYSKQEKDTHEWQQGTIEAAYLINCLTHPDELVVDPFCGGGTTCVAALMSGRSYLAFEIDADTANNARERIHAVS